MKLVVHEPQSKALRASVRGRHLVATEIADVEVRRAVRRADVRLERPLRAVLDALQLIPVDEGVRHLAATVDPPLLRTLDAIHLATALLVEGLNDFISYDGRLAGAARDRGFTVLSPS